MKTTPAGQGEGQRTRTEIQMHDQNTSAPALFRYDDETAVRVVKIDGEVTQ